MKKQSKQLEYLYAKALTKMPFYVSFIDSRYFCSFCHNKGVKIRYFYLKTDKFPSSFTFCSKECLTMHQLKRL